MKSRYFYKTFAIYIAMYFFINICIPNALPIANAAVNVVYVKPTAIGAQDGSSWNDATNNIQAAINKSGISEVHIAKGLYTITTPLTLKNGVAVIGGFEGNETDSTPTGSSTLLDGGGVVRGFKNVSGLNNSATLDNVTIQNCNSPISENYGGGMFIPDGSAIISNCIFKNNKSNNGGAVFVGNGDSTFKNCTFNNNTSIFGGAIDIIDGTTKIVDCNFIGNSSTQDGGAICINSANASISNSTITNNSAPNSKGGGIYNLKGNPTVTNSKIADNTAVDGGGMYSGAGKPVVTNTEFNKNTAKNGGGYFNSTDNSRLIKCTFIANKSQAGSNGAGLQISNGSPFIANCTFDANLGYWGGGANVSNPASPTFVNSLFINNIGNSNGGGICNNTSGTTKIVNCTFTNNSSGIANYNVSFSLINSILIGNSGSEIKGDKPTNVTYINSIVGSNYIAGPGASPSITVATPIIDASGRLVAGSYAKDKGNTSEYDLVASTITDDLDGNSRIVNKFIDIGAFELQMYNVTYDPNGATGTPPVDSSSYFSGESATVLSDGSLAKANYSFNGWNTKLDGSGTPYKEGDLLPISGIDVTLYAVWSMNPKYKVTYDPNGATGTPPVDSSSYFSGETTLVKTASNLTKVGYIFAGWNTAMDGSGMTFQPGSILPIPSKNMTLFAMWKQEAMFYPSLPQDYTYTYDNNNIYLYEVYAPNNMSSNIPPNNGNWYQVSIETVSVDEATIEDDIAQ